MKKKITTLILLGMGILMLASNTWAAVKCGEGEVFVSGQGCVKEAHQGGADLPTQACSNVPLLEHFTITENVYTQDAITLTFAPKGTPHFYLHIKLESSNGRDVLSAWCTGDESLCKAVGNGETCSGTDYTGANAWCYKAN